MRCAKITRIADNLFVLAVFSIAILMVAVFATSPARAKFGVLGGYKYINIPNNNIDYGAHVLQLDILSTLGTGYREGGKRPRHALGIAMVAGGGGSAKIGGMGSADSLYFAIPFVYEYVFPFGLGVSAGVSVPFYVAIGKAVEGGESGESGESGKSAFLTGISISDLGLNYHFKNGWTIYGRGNVGSASVVLGAEGLDGRSFLAWGVGVGGGLWY